MNECECAECTHEQERQRAELEQPTAEQLGHEVCDPTVML